MLNESVILFAYLVMMAYFVFVIHQFIVFFKERRRK